VQGKRLNIALCFLSAVMCVFKPENGAIVDGCAQHFAQRIYFAMCMHGWRVDLRAFYFRAAVFGQRENDFVESGNGCIAEPLPCEGLGHTQTHDDGFDFIGREHKGSQFKRAVEAVADTCLALYGDSGEGDIADVAIDGALGDGKEPCKLRGGGEPPRTQVLHDLEEPVSATHAETISGIRMNADAVSFCVDKMCEGAHAGRQLGARQDDLAAGW